MLITSAVVVVTQWLVAALAGWAVVGWCDPDTRRRLEPALPAIGLAAVIVVFSLGSAVAPMQIVAPVVMVIIVGGVAVNLRRGRRPTATMVTALLLPLLLPSVAMLLLARPMLLTQTGTVMASPNHDAMFYVSAAEWAVDHPVTESPVLVSSPSNSDDAPATAAAVHVEANSLRVGDVTLAAATRALGSGPIRHHWLMQVIGWLLFVPSSLAAAAEWLGIGRQIRGSAVAVGSLVVASSSVLAFQVLNQNSASVLGTVLAPMTLAAVWAWLDGGDERPPLWLAGVTLAALLGSYLEYTPILVIAFAVVILARQPARIPSAVGRGLAVAGATVVIGPVAVYRTVRALLFLSGVTAEGFPTLYRHVSLPLIAARYLGPAWPRELVASNLATAFVVVVVAVGCAVIVVGHRSRWLWIGMAIGGSVTAWYVAAVVGSEYSHQRAVEIVQPFLLLAAVFGWLVAAERRGSSTGRNEDTLSVRAPSVRAPSVRAPSVRAPSVRALTAVAVVVWAVVAAVALTTTGRSLPSLDVMERRAVDATYDDVTTWAERYGGPDGSDLTVVTSGYEETLWATDALRNEPDVDYPLTYLGYLWGLDFSDAGPAGVADRYLLIDRQSVVMTPGVIPVEQNDRFLLFDTTVAPLVVVSPRRFQLGRTETDGTVRWVWVEHPGELAAVRTVGAAGEVTLRLSAPEWMAPLDVEVDAVVDEGVEPQLGSQLHRDDDDRVVDEHELVVDTGATDVTIGLDPGPVTIIEVDPGGPGRAPPDGSDVRGLAVRIEPVVD